VFTQKNLFIHYKTANGLQNLAQAHKYDGVTHSHPCGTKTNLSLISWKFHNAMM